MVEARLQPVPSTPALRITLVYILDRLPAESVRCYALRHASATAMVRVSIHPKTVSASFGHSQISITMNPYVHAMRDAHTDAAQQLGSVIRGGRKSTSEAG